MVSLRNLRLTIFSAELNNLELWGAVIGNAYLEAYTDENFALLLVVNSENMKDTSYSSMKHSMGPDQLVPGVMTDFLM